MNEEIREAIKRLAHNSSSSPVSFISARVKEVDWDKRLCTCEDEEGVEFFDVRLRAIADDSKKGICLKPKVDSYVLLGAINNFSSSRFVAMYTEIDALEIIADDEVLMADIAKGEFTFNKGENKGLVKIEKLVDKLTALEKDLNSLKMVFSSTWTPSPQDGGAALKIAAATWSAQRFTETQKVDLENDKIKH